MSEFQKQVRKKHYTSQKSVRSQRDTHRGNSPGMLRMTGIIVSLPQTFRFSRLGGSWKSVLVTRTPNHSDGASWLSFGAIGQHGL